MRQKVSQSTRAMRLPSGARREGSEFVEHIGDDAPDMDMLAVGDLDFRVFRVGWREEDRVPPANQALDQQFALQGGDDHLAMARLRRAIHHEKIAVMDARTCHGIP